MPRSSRSRDHKKPLHAALARDEVHDQRRGAGKAAVTRRPRPSGIDWYSPDDDWKMARTRRRQRLFE